jgi:hypothetical protein
MIQSRQWLNIRFSWKVETREDEPRAAHHSRDSSNKRPRSDEGPDRQIPHYKHQRRSGVNNQQVINYNTLRRELTLTIATDTTTSFVSCHA